MKTEHKIFHKIHIKKTHSECRLRRASIYLLLKLLKFTSSPEKKWNWFNRIVSHACSEKIWHTIGEASFQICMTFRPFCIADDTIDFPFCFPGWQCNNINYYGDYWRNSIPCRSQKYKSFSCPWNSLNSTQSPNIMLTHFMPSSVPIIWNSNASSSSSFSLFSPLLFWLLSFSVESSSGRANF